MPSQDWRLVAMALWELDDTALAGTATPGFDLLRAGIPPADRLPVRRRFCQSA